MGIPLGLVSLNILGRFHENLLFGRYHKPHVYLPYVGDTFSVFDSVPKLQFTVRMESGRVLPDLNVLVERKERSFITSV